VTDEEAQIRAEAKKHEDWELIQFLNEHAKLEAALRALRRAIAAMPEQPSAKKAPAEYKVWREEMDAYTDWAVTIHERRIRWNIQALDRKRKGLIVLHYA
jgi:hypothetical protein